MLRIKLCDIALFLSPFLLLENASIAKYFSTIVFLFRESFGEGEREKEREKKRERQTANRT